MKINVYIILLLIPFIGCKEEFTIKNESYQQNLVINGTISNEDGPYTIKISKSAPVNEFTEIPVQGCTVLIYEKSGTTENYEELTEIEPGVYQTAVGGMQGKIGNSYSLSVITPEGQEYITDYQEIKEPVEIESIDYELLVKDHEDYTYGLPGYQFYITSKEATTKDNYFLWQLTETYEYQNDYKVTDYFLGYGTVLIGDSVVFEEERNDTLLQFFNEKVYTCWKTQPVNYIYTGKTDNLATPQIIKQPLEFITTETKKLSIRYSLLVKQLTISEQAFYYWQKLEEQSSNDNFLVASQPYSIIGNIRNANNEDDLVFGYFTVSSVYEKRVFANRPNKPFYCTECYVITDQETINDILSRQNPPHYYATTDDGEGIIDSDCIDCRTAGGTINKPDFWID
ncbi:MAG: DUF4249 domain-containing protein [Bacteroidetes bacterium]|nr:DUF4249 domain-containing protein [Bacteroidota bacterium]